MFKRVKSIDELSEQDRGVAYIFLVQAGAGEDRFSKASKVTGLAVGVLRQLERIMEGEDAAYPDDQVASLVNAVQGMPAPPEHLLDKTDKRIHFVPAPEMSAWMIATYVSQGGTLAHKVHKHLAYAPPAVLWTNVLNSRGGNRVAGTASMPTNVKGGDPWVIAQRKYQLMEWFGKLPQFLITLDARLWEEEDYRRRLCVAEHEMLHCGHKRDKFNVPMWSRETGQPIFCMRPHDVEVFVHEGERYGVGASSGASVKLFEAWKNGPSVTDAQIAQACGTCRR